jgi:prepilin-type N-terminal cleavage/methylation domain-containing protein
VKVARRKSGFTLIELLVVITILGILAGLAVPALKNLGNSDANISAARQLLDDVGRARQFAISQHTTVYMVFVPPDFWNGQTFSAADQTVVTSLYEKQYTGYAFITLHTVGDQPGQNTPHYLAPWQMLPDNTFIATNKFSSRYPGYVVGGFTVLGFSVTNIFPFPSATSATFPWLPYIAFNSQGQPTITGQTPSYTAEFIPLAHGPVGYAVDQNKVPQQAVPQPEEIPPGNSTGSAFNLVHVDPLTGRAVLEYQKVQ